MVTDWADKEGESGRCHGEGKEGSSGRRGSGMEGGMGCPPEISSTKICMNFQF